MYPDHDGLHPESELFGTEPEAYLYAYAFTKKALASFPTVMKSWPQVSMRVSLPGETPSMPK